MARLHWLPVPAVLTAMALAGPALAAPARTTHEGEAALRKQVAAGQVRAATVYTHRHVVHASLAGGRRYSVTYRPADRRALVASLLSHHVRFHVVKASSGHHGLRLRYIALIVLAAIAAAGAIVFVVVRRRRGRDGPAVPVAD